MYQHQGLEKLAKKTQMRYWLTEDMQKQAVTDKTHTKPMSANLLARRFNEALPNLACV